MEIHHGYSNGPLLLVEDNISDQMLIKEAFNTLGILNTLVIVNNGVEALKYLQDENNQPILIICDMDMPLMNGIELRKQIYNNDKLRKKSVPFIFLTSNESNDFIDSAFLDYSVQGYFFKQNDFDKTVEILKLIINYWKESKHPQNKFHQLVETK